LAKEKPKKKPPSLARANTLAEISSLHHLIRQAESYPVLGIEQEQALAQKAHVGDERAYELLVGSHMRLVIKLARGLQWDHPGLQLEDLIQEGALGLAMAAQRFDPARGVRFSTFASRYISGYILRSIAQAGRAVRLPVWKVQALGAYQRGRTALARGIGREPTHKEIARSLQLDDDQVAEFELLSFPLTSVEQAGLGRPVHWHIGRERPRAIGADPYLIRALSTDTRDATSLSTNVRDATWDAAAAQERELVRRAVQDLDEPHQSVIRYRYYEGDRPLTYAQIGKKLVPPRSEQRVWKIEREGLDRLRKALALPFAGTRRREPRAPA
jgi:RNA polymerase sigma factor (sigma-70 family)